MQRSLLGRRLGSRRSVQQTISRRPFIIIGQRIYKNGNINGEYQVSWYNVRQSIAQIEKKKLDRQETGARMTDRNIAWK